VPLSEEEQRILSEIEQGLYASDPALAREIADSTLYRHAARNLRWAVLGFVVGVVALLGTLHISYALAFVGFLIMLGSALAIERNLRAMGKAGVEQLTASARAQGLRDAFGSTGQRMRDRFRRDD
jgi:urea transporter